MIIMQDNINFNNVVFFGLLTVATNTSVVF